MENRIDPKRVGSLLPEGNGSGEEPAPGPEGLPPGYHCISGIPCHGGRIDRVVVGPAGIYVIDSHRRCGTVLVEGETLLLDGEPAGENLVDQAWFRTLQVKGMLRELIGWQWSVLPLICFTAATITGRRSIKGVAVVGGAGPGNYLKRQKRLLSPEEVDQVVRCLRAAAAGTTAGETE